MIFSTLIFLLWVEIDWSAFSGDSVSGFELSVEYISNPSFGVIGLLLAEFFV